MEDRLHAIAAEIRSTSNAGGVVPSTPLAVCLVTLGCAKNEVDSAEMATKLGAAGCRIVEEPGEAECIIVNTCSFIQAATEESLEVVFEMCGLPAVQNNKAKVVVAGCMPSRYADGLASSLTEVETFVPCSKEDDIGQIVAGLFPGRFGASQLALPVGGVSSYIKISDGCDRFCSFCTIPVIRGRYKSFSYGQVNAAVSRAISAGAHEIVLIAQDTGRWGQDFKEASSLAALLGSLARKHPQTWFRVMYVQPEGVTEELLEVIATHANVASYLDIPFQHCCSHILSAMNRRGSREDYLARIAHIRQQVPGIALRTTLIAGFPGESEDDFEQLCSFVEEAEFDYVGVFAYSQEEGTRAAKLPGQIPEEEKQDRANRLREIADSISAVRIANHIGKRMDVLVLGREEDGQLYGRTMLQAPEVDGVVYIPSGTIGSVKQVTIIDTALYEMEGE